MSPDLGELKAARFLPPDGKQYWVVTSNGELRLYAFQEENKEWFGEPRKEAKWVLKKTVPATEASKNNKPVFSLDGNSPEIYFGNELRDLSGQDKHIYRGSDFFKSVKGAGPGFSLGKNSDSRAGFFRAREHKTCFADAPTQDVSQMSADYHGEIVLSGDQFYYVSETENKLVSGPKLDSGPVWDANVQQVLSKDSCLVGVVDRPGSLGKVEKGTSWRRRLMITEPGKTASGVIVAEENVSEPLDSNPAMFSLARLQPDGSVLVCKNNGEIELYDGEPVETEPIEKRLEAAGEAIKILGRTPIVGGIAINLEIKLKHCFTQITEPTGLNYSLFKSAEAEILEVEEKLKSLASDKS